jgi:predicted enzyme related to lactoylglutathione lyase
MAIKGMHLGWIIVKDHAKSKEFFKSLGLKMSSQDSNYGWAEFSGKEEGGALLGVGQESPDCADYGAMKAGMNAVMTMTVDDIVATKAEFEAKGVKFLGDIMEVPGHVKLATFVDLDNNMFQLAQMLYTK